MAAQTRVGMALQLDGFESLEEVGRGGFGVVYRAWQPAFGRHVAIKVLAATEGDDDWKARVDREALAMGTVTGHPNIVTILSAGSTPLGARYFVMPYLAGGSLGDRIQQSGPVSWRQATACGVAIAGALHTAHLAGVIHRDVKPDNILISEFGEPQLADFGIARMAGLPQTASGRVNATIVYAPPEVLAGSPPSASSDVYSLAATVYAGIAGQPPFAAVSDESLASVIGRIATQPPSRPRPSFPDPVWAVLEWGLEKEAADRPASAAEFGGALQRAERLAGSQMTPMTIPDTSAGAEQRTRDDIDSTVKTPGTTSLPALNTVFMSRGVAPPTPRARRRRRRRWAAAAVSAAAALGLGAAAVISLAGNPEDVEAAPTEDTSPVPAPSSTVLATTSPPPATTAAPPVTVNPGTATELPDDGRAVVTSLGNLRPGDCFSSDFVGSFSGVSYEAQRIPCGIEHDAEVAGIVNPGFSEDVYPGLDTLGAVADERCPEMFERYVGAPVGVEFVSLTYEVPTETEWLNGPWEEIFCVLVGTEGSPLVGSKQDLRG